MTQIATVTALPAAPGGLVELTVTRLTACGHSCDGCGQCAGRAPDLVIQAESGVPVALGDRVEVYSGNQILGFAALVYGFPVLLFLLGYLLSAFLTEPWRYACGGTGFLLGLAIAVLCDRKAKRRAAVSYRIVRKL